MQDIQLTLTVDETNVILAALGEQSYKQVFQLVAKIQQQANEQLQAQPQNADSTLAGVNHE